MRTEFLSVSPDGQIIIPASFVSALGVDTNAICILKDSEIVLRPANKQEDDFSDLILADLLQEGYTGVELLSAFKQRKAMVRPAVENLIDMAKKAAHGEGEFYTDDDIWGKTRL